MQVGLNTKNIQKNLEKKKFQVHQKCVVPNCNGDDPSRFQIPKNSDLQKQWLEICSIDINEITRVSQAKICGKHFKTKNDDKK